MTVSRRPLAALGAVILALFFLAGSAGCIHGQNPFATASATVRAITSTAAALGSPPAPDSRPPLPAHPKARIAQIRRAALEMPAIEVTASAPSVAAPERIAPTPEDPAAFVAILLEAVAAKNWVLVGALAVMALTWALRRWAPIPWFQTDRGGAVLVLATALAGTFATALLGGAPLSLGLVLTALVVGLSAAGGYGVIRKIAWPKDAKPDDLDFKGASAGEQSAAPTSP